MITPSVHFFGKVGDRWFSPCPISVSKHPWQSQLKCKMNWYTVPGFFIYIFSDSTSIVISQRKCTINKIDQLDIFFIFSLSLSLWINLTQTALWSNKALANLVTTFIYLQIPICTCINTLYNNLKTISYKLYGHISLTKSIVSIEFNCLKRRNLLGPNMRVLLKLDSSLQSWGVITLEVGAKVTNSWFSGHSERPTLISTVAHHIVPVSEKIRQW